MSQKRCEKQSTDTNISRKVSSNNIFSESVIPAYTTAVLSHKR